MTAPSPEPWQEQVEWNAAIAALAPVLNAPPPPDTAGLTFKPSKLTRSLQCDIPGGLDIARLEAVVATVGADTTDPLLAATTQFCGSWDLTAQENLDEVLADFKEGLEESWLYDTTHLPFGVVRYRFHIPWSDPDDQGCILMYAAASLLCHPKIAAAVGALNIEVS